MAARVPFRSDYVKTPIHGFRPVNKVPAPLTGEGQPYERTPLYHGVRQTACEHDKGADEYLDQAANAVIDEWLLIATPVRNGVGKLTIEQCVSGLPLDYYDSLDMASSEGWPWVKGRPPGCNNKSWMFVDGEINSELRRVINFRNDMRERCITPPTVYMDCLKDAKIDATKFHQPGKTRLFGCGPVDATISHRQYLNDMLASITIKNVLLEHAVGLNPTGPDWRELAALIQQQTNFFDGDHSKFGQRLLYRIGIHFSRYACKWYEINGDTSVKHRNARRVIIEEEMFHALHIVMNVVYQTFMGIPNGGFGTVQINTFANAVFFRRNFILLVVRHHAEIGLSQYRYMTRIYFWGDDVIGSVSDKISCCFNNITVAREFQAIGMKYTTSEKTDMVDKPFVTFDHLQFIGRKFVPHPSARLVLLAPVDSDSIESILQWQFRAEDEEISFEENVEAAFLLAYDSGPSYYEQLRNDVLMSLRQAELAITIPTWEEQDFKRRASWYRNM
jgi:hypothetical protein